MASLRQVTDTSRQALVIGFFFVVGIFLLISLVNIFKSLHPAPPPPPTVSFGKLPSIIFPTPTTNTTFEYNLDTLSGNLPNLGNQATIYKILQTQPTLTALDSAKTLAASIGYLSDPVRISDTDYAWTNDDTLPKTLLLNIFTNNFAITSAYTTNQDILSANNLPDENGAIDMVKQFLQNASLLPSDIDISKTKTTLLSISNGQLSPATSLSSAQIIQIDLFQNDINGISIFYPQSTHSTMNFYVGGGESSAQIVLANFNHQSISQNKATYPIISAQQAFDALKKGQGYVASYDGSGTSISIHTIMLGYYMSDQPMSYLEPVVIFEGNNGFSAYVPAIADTWLQK